MKTEWFLLSQRVKHESRMVLVIKMSEAWTQNGSCYQNVWSMKAEWFLLSKWVKH